MEARYARNIPTLTPEAQAALGKKRVLLAGCGGLGGALLELLLRVGVGAVTAVDPDRFEESNANRQILCTAQTLGQPKVLAARDRAFAVRPDVGFTAVLEAGVTGLAPGCGDPMFDGIENLLARAVFALPGVTGLGFGAGSKAAAMKGSEHNDAFRVKDGAVTTATNHAGGILGGISNGMPLLLNVNVRTPLSAEGEGKRYQHLLIPALVPALESLIAMTLLDLTAHRFENR